jgi:cytochrome c-type biogenesis protein CcmH/NrfF
MKQFVEKVQPDQLHFTASKEVEKGQNPESRAKLYDRMVQRYASAIGYKPSRMDTGMDIQYELHKG